MGNLINRDELPHTPHSHELVGSEYGLPLSLILVHSGPGTGPAMHRHPYPEVFVVEHGEATFRVDDVSIVGESGQIVVAPANTYHGFTNTGTGELRLTAIHTAAAFDTEWLDKPDTEWIAPDKSD